MRVNRRSWLLAAVVLVAACTHAGQADVRVPPPAPDSLRATPSVALNTSQTASPLRGEARIAALTAYEVLMNRPGLTAVRPYFREEQALRWSLEESVDPRWGVQRAAGSTHVLSIVVTREGDNGRKGPLTVSYQLRTLFGDVLWDGGGSVGSGRELPVISAKLAASVVAYLRPKEVAPARPPLDTWRALTPKRFATLRSALAPYRTRASQSNALARLYDSASGGATDSASRLTRRLLRRSGAPDDRSTLQALNKRRQAWRRLARDRRHQAEGFQAAESLVESFEQGRPRHDAWRSAIRRLQHTMIRGVRPKPLEVVDRPWFRQGRIEGAAVDLESALERRAALANAEEAGGFRLLHLAAERGHAEAARVLVRHGARVDARDRLGQSALHRAAWRGHDNVVALLLERGAAAEARDAFASAPLHFAAWGGDVDVVHRLLRAGVSLESRNELLETPLIVASAVGQHRVVTALLDAGARQDLMDIAHRSALGRAVEHHRARTVGVLLNHRRPPSARHIVLVAENTVGTGRTAMVEMLASALGPGKELDLLLHGTAGKASGDDVLALLAAGANPSVQHDGTYPIEEAVKYRNLNAVAALAEAGRKKSPSVARRPLDLALVAAVGLGWQPGVARMFELGAIPGATSRAGDPLPVVVVKRLGSRGLPMLKQLVAAAVDLSAGDLRGDTALHHAAGDGVLIDDLVKLGIDPNVKAKDGTSPLWIAESVGRTATRDRLLALGAEAGLHTASAMGRKDLLRAALKRGGRVNGVDRRGWTPLHWAAFRRAGSDILRMLVKAGAAVDQRTADKWGRTALHFAAKARDGAMVKLLLKAGASPVLKDASGTSPKSLWPEGFGKGDRKLKGRKGLTGMGMAGRAGKGVAAAMGAAARESGGFRRRDVTTDLLDISPGDARRHHLGSVDVAADLAKSLVASGDYEAALRVYEDTGAMVAKGSPGGYLWFAMLNNIGRVETFRGTLDAAASTLKAAQGGLDALRRSHQRPAKLDAWASHGERHRWRRARRQARRQLAKFERAWTFAASNSAHLDAIRGTPLKAVGGFRKVLARRKKLGLSSLVAATQEDLAVALMEAGQYREAEAAFSAARAGLSKTSAPRHRTLALMLNEGQLYRRIGAEKRANRSARAVVDGLVQPPPRGDEWGLLAAAHLALGHSKDGEAARAHFEAAASALEKGYDGQHELVVAALIGQARTRQGTQRVALVNAARDAILALYGKDHPGMAEILVLTSSELSEHSRAVELLEEAVFVADGGSLVDLQWSTRIALAERLEKAGRLRSAVFVLKQAVQAMEQVRGRAPTKWQQRFVENKAPTYRKLAGLLVDQGRIPQAQATLALLKRDELAAFTLRAGPSTARAAFSDGEGELGQAFSAMRDQVGVLSKRRAELRALRSQRALSDVEKEELKGLRKKLRVVRKTFSDRLASLESELRVEGRQERSLRSLRALQGTLARLDAKAVALHYVVAKERLHIILTSSEVQLAESVPITAVALNRKIATLRRALTDPDSDVAAPARAVYDAVLKPIAGDLKKLGARTLLVAPDGALRYVPFAALHDGTRYVVERFAVVGFSEAARDKLGQPARKSKVSVAGLGVSAKLGEFSALPSVPKELNGIVISDPSDGDGVLPGVVKLDKAFDVEALRDALDDGHAMLHLATHFELRPGTVRDSFLLLGDGAHLTLDAIKYDDFDFRNVELLTLSACNTGMGLGPEQNSGREIEGFGALAQNLGAKSVIATLWPVADESTGLFMQRFYKLRATQSGTSKAEAMRRIQVKLLRGSLKSAEHPDVAKPFSHPYFWAPFILLGDWL